MNPENATPIIIYEDAGHAVEVRLDARHDTVWLTQAQMAALFDLEFCLVPTLPRGNAYGAHSWAEAVIYPVTQPEQPHVMTLTVLHWIPEDSMCAITLPLIAPTRA